MHEEQTLGGAVSDVIEAVQKSKCCSPMEFQSGEGRNDSLKLASEGYLKREEKKQRKTKGQPQLVPRQHASGADILKDISRAISEDNYDSTARNQHTTNPPAGLTSLPVSDN